MVTQTKIAEKKPALTSLYKLGKVVRISALSLLFAGSAAIVFAAVILVKIGEAKGLTTAQAAAANAPIFIYFSKVAAGACVILLIAEATDSLLIRRLSKLKLAQYVTSVLCCLCAFIFAFFIAPSMERLLTIISYDATAHESFHKLHQLSRILFSGIILFAWTSLILPIFAETRIQDGRAEGEITGSN